MTKIYKRYLISGRVQGVSYRAATRRQALQLAISGWVRNRSDGTVEALACGNEQQLEAFQQWLWQGPLLAKVSAVFCEDIKAVEELTDFTILQTAL